MSITKRFTKFLSKRATKARQHLKFISRASTLVNEIDLTNHHDMLLEVKQQKISQIDFDCEKSRKFKFEGTKYRKIQRGAQGLKKLEEKGDFSKFENGNFYHRLHLDSKDDFSLDSISVCESVIVEEKAAKRMKKGTIFDEEIREFLGFVVRKISNNSEGLQTIRA